MKFHRKHATSSQNFIMTQQLLVPLNIGQNLMRECMYAKGIDITCQSLTYVETKMTLSHQWHMSNNN
jgi:hypothetical protein